LTTALRFEGNFIALGFEVGVSQGAGEGFRERSRRRRREVEDFVVEAKKGRKGKLPEGGVCCSLIGDAACPKQLTKKADQGVAFVERGKAVANGCFVERS